MKRAVVCSALMILGAVPAAAQDAGHGSVVGRVLSGTTVLSGASVELVLNGNVQRRMSADSAGTFLFPGVPAGSYDVVVTHIGYRSGGAQGVRVTGGETVQLRVELAPAPVSLAAVEAATSVVRIDTRSTEFSTSISKEQIRRLPLGYDPKSVVALTPGARAGHVWGGATAQANNYQIDGLAANHPGVGGDLVQLNMTWIDRIDVRGLGAGAEHGNFQGGLVNVITKSGDNERTTAFRSSSETHQLNASNLQSTEIGAEVASRFDMEAETQGPVLRDRLFYYVSGQLIKQDDRHVNHLPGVAGRYAPELEQSREAKLFGKLTWRVTPRNLLEASLIRLDEHGDGTGNTGYESAEATLERRRITSLYNLQWQHTSGWGSLDARLAHISLDETRSPYGDAAVPGLQTFAQLPPYVAYQNAALRFRHAPASTTGSFAWTLRGVAFGREQAIKVGAEHSVGSHIDQRLRNGGLTWRPPRRASLDPANPDTWMTSFGAPFVPVTFGGEVDLQAAVENSALFAQAAFSIGPRLVLSPGVRYGRWIGRLTPAGGGAAFTAVDDAAAEPRLGAILDVTGNGSFVLKGHWGQYHQGMIAQFFDRAAGGNVFTDEETWYYYRTPDNPGMRLSEQQRQQLAQQRLLTLQRVIKLNETGPVVNYRQPYIDQWLVGVEKSFGTSVKLEGLYIDRRNRRMVALVDRNAATNYTLYEYVRVLGADGAPIPFEGGRVQLRQLYVPNNAIVDVLRLVARGECVDGCSPPPGLVPADTLRLSWNPDYVLTNVPQARREFNQLQLSIRVARPSWGGTASLVLTDLQGDLDNVTGYEDPSGYGAGPYVRVNEGVNAFGKLPNFSKRELKLSVFGNLGWRTTGGVFWTWATGDHYSPHFTLSAASGLYQYRLYYGNRPVWQPMLKELEGHRVFIGPRGRPSHEARGMLDVRLERETPMGRFGNWNFTLEAFNLVNMSTVTKVNESANRGRNYYWFLGPQRQGLFNTIDPNEFYKAVLERVPPRTIRLGAAILL